MNKLGNVIHESTRTILSLSVLVAYLSVLLLSPLHEISHQPQQEEICYEDNACHLRLVHHDTENGCDHESHVSDEKLNCELCALRHIKTAIEYHAWTHETPFFDFASDYIVAQSGRANSYVAGILVRGPPLNS